MAFKRSSVRSRSAPVKITRFQSGFFAVKNFIKLPQSPIKNRRYIPPLDDRVTPNKLTEGSATIKTEGNQAQVAAYASSTSSIPKNESRVKPAS